MKTRKLTSVLLSPDFFKACFYFISILGVCPLLGHIVEPYLKVFHVYALAVIVFDFFGEKRILRNKGRFLLILFTVCGGITLLLNPNLLNFSGLSNFCYLFATLTLVYSYGKDSAKYNVISSAILCIVISLANLVGIWMFFSKFHLYIPERGYIGIYPSENRLAGLFGNPNVLGMVCLGAICLCAIQFCNSRSYRAKLCFGIMGGINLVTLLLSNSRTQIYSLVFMSAVLAFMLVLKARRNLKGILRAAAAAGLCAAIVFGGCKLAQQGLSRFDWNYTYYLQHICTDNRVPPNDENPSEPSKPTDPAPSAPNDPTTTIDRFESGGLNGRLRIWLNGLKLFAQKPVFGCGMDNINYSLEALGYPALQTKGNLHNIYLEVLVCFGIAGFCCLLAFLLIMLRETIAFFRYSEGKAWVSGAVMLACVAAFLLDGIADSTLIASFYPTAISFWFIASRFAGLMESENMRTNHYRKELLWKITDKLLSVRKK